MKKILAKYKGIIFIYSFLIVLVVIAIKPNKTQIKDSTPNTTEVESSSDNTTVPDNQPSNIVVTESSSPTTAVTESSVSNATAKENSEAHSTAPAITPSENANSYYNMTPEDEYLRDMEYKLEQIERQKQTAMEEEAEFQAKYKDNPTMLRMHLLGMSEEAAKKAMELGIYYDEKEDTFKQAK